MLKTQEILNRLGATRNATNHPYEKLQILVDYIAEKMDGNANDEEKLYEVVFAAKKNIAETILHSQSENKIKHTSKELCSRVKDVDQKTANTMMSMFLLSPETTTKMMTQAQIEEPDPKSDVKLTEEEAQYQQKRKEEQLAKYNAALKLLSGKELSYAAYESARGDILNDKLNLMGYLQEDLPGDDPIGEAVETCKPGFFERMFRRTSKEYKNFISTFEARQHGGASRDQVDNAAKAYLKHKIPDWDGKGFPTDAQMARLSGTSKNRAVLCYRTLQANKKSRGYEERLATIQGVADQNLVDYGAKDTFKAMCYENSDLGPITDSVNKQPEQQAKFQSGLANDINDQIKPDVQELNGNDNLIVKDKISLE